MHNNNNNENGKNHFLVFSLLQQFSIEIFHRFNYNLLIFVYFLAKVKIK